VDDSDGGLSEAIARLEEIHLAACEAGSPDPVELAERLVTRAVSSDYEVFLDVLPAYEEVLGSAGLARYRQLVEQGWRKLPPKKPNDYGARRFVITHLMENLAESSGGTDGLIEALARDLTSTYDVLRIAERLCADGRDDEALTWLERGLADFDPDFRLRDLAAEIHLRAGRRDLAGEMLWANFTDRPSLETFRTLRHATAEGFPLWRERALAWLSDAPPATGSWSSGRSTLVEILLADDEIDAAWQAAVDGGARTVCGSASRAPVPRATRPTPSRSSSARPTGRSSSATVTPTRRRPVCWPRPGACSPAATATVTSATTSPRCATRTARSGRYAKNSTGLTCPDQASVSLRLGACMIQCVRPGDPRTFPAHQLSCGVTTGQ
jgi:hypothetical protein